MPLSSHRHGRVKAVKPGHDGKNQFRQEEK
jgi:hypothetical protein